jgi:membrane associated rhomboid family serine protease
MSGGRDGNGGRALACRACGAINGADFDRCVRCGAAISPLAGTADRLRTYMDGESLAATKAIAALTLFVFALQSMASLARAKGSPVEALLGGHVVDSFRFGALLVSRAAVANEPWRLLSAVFVHYGAIHAIMNLLGLASFGRMAEPAVGSARFFLAYVVTGVAGFAITVGFEILTGGGGYPTAGASGAVFGMSGLVLGILLRRRNPQWKQFAVQAVLYGVLFGFMVNATNAGFRINNSAHLGGLVVGIGFGLVYAGRVGAPAAVRRRSDLWTNVAALTAAAACLASLALAQRSPLWRAVDALAETRDRGEAPPTPLSAPATPGLAPAAETDP